MAKAIKSALKSTAADMARTVNEASKTGDKFGVKASGDIVPLATRGRNTPELIEDTVILTEARRAFEDYDSGDALQNNATQRLAYAVMAYHARLVFERPDADVPALAKVMTDKAIKATLLGDMGVRQFFIGTRPPTGNKANEHTADALTLYANHDRLLGRAVDLAGALALRNVLKSQWNDKAGLWNVPCRYLFPADFEPTNAALNAKIVLLDGRGYGGNGTGKNGQPKWMKVNASVNQFVSAARPAKVSVEGNGTGSGQGNDAEFTKAIGEASLNKLANALSFDKAVAVFHELFVKSAPRDAKLSDLKDKPHIVKMLSDISQKYDEMRHNDEKAKQA